MISGGELGLNHPLKKSTNIVSRKILSRQSLKMLFGDFLVNFGEIPYSIIVIKRQKLKQIYHFLTFTTQKM